MKNNLKSILKFESAKQKWWGKPLVIFGDRAIPAELAILNMELLFGEEGVWMNSRGFKSGVVDLIVLKRINKKNSYSTQRINLPDFVSEKLKSLYQMANVKRGCPDLVIWNLKSKKIRLVEVKNPHWDEPSPEQNKFLFTAREAGVFAKIVDWEFLGGVK